MFKLEELKIRRRSWVQMANIPAARRGWTLADCTATNENDIADIKQWLGLVRDEKIIRASGNPNCGFGLMLMGSPGNGKTTIALSILQEVLTTFPLESLDVERATLTRPCYFATFNDIIELKGRLIEGGTDEEETLYAGMLGDCANDVYNIRILVIDDIGKEHASLSGWQKNLLHHVLRTRFNNGLPTIVTTNIKLENWVALYGDATASFANEAFMYLPIESKRGDLRK